MWGYAGWTSRVGRVALGSAAGFCESVAMILPASHLRWIPVGLASGSFVVSGGQLFSSSGGEHLHDVACRHVLDVKAVKCCVHLRKAIENGQK